MDEVCWWLATVVCVMIGACSGNYLGDQGIFRDCAIKGTAKMMGGGVIKCEVVKEERK